MGELHWETISPEMRQVMGGFGQTEIGERFYLAGGTALALQLGHRKSFDLDFFSPTEDIPTIREVLMEALKPFDPILASSAWGNLVFLALGVRVGFYGYDYVMLGEYVLADQTRLASVEDIGLMKLDALLARASRKDFHDLYAICQEVLPLKKLMEAASKKYPDTRDFEAMVTPRLAYFARAEEEEPVPLIKPAPWERVKDFFELQAFLIGRSWIE
jgi:hypothetical protein